MTTWNVEKARQRYAVPYWGENYFDVDAQGRVVAQPQGPEGPRVCLDDIVSAATARGSRLPLLVRFSDILHHRRSRLQAAFAKVMADWDYTGGYTAVFPIKTNQQRGVAGELASQGDAGFGLEAGSKPELMAVLALARPGSTVICNGYKDREYIRLALIGRRLGLEIYIVIEKPSELTHVIEESRALGVEPLLGVRMRLATLGAGKWQNTGGDKAKFGLTPRQVLDLVDQLKATGLDHTLKLLHFHMGSQLSNVRDIAGGVREAVRYFVELSKMGLPISTMDVGGGLGVDYEGSRSRSFCSINYGLEQYAATIVQPLAEACAEHGLPAPRVITEAGRAMTAHHAVLVVNVSEVEKAPEGAIPPSRPNEPAVLRHLRDIYAELDERPVMELYQEALHHVAEGQTLYALGQLSLDDRARLDDLFYAIVNVVRGRLKPDERAHRQAIDELDLRLVDKYFVNFSVFESIPDVWAIDQVFPIVPITRLDEEPTRRGVIGDLTCDSDGRIDQYVEEDGIDVSLPLHALQPGQPYRLGIFLVGAYQETLGDIHNLFGDTDALSVRLDAQGKAELTAFKRGDTCDVMLDYVGYDLAALRAAYRDKIAASGLDASQVAHFEAALETGLTGYTYLAES
ncbi:biosynthetic arginine decarboxylase [Tahibacter amnicola]|uniref:Biosynthetic arginine decarboxylase n=1 Tax=Tahibacter amnicola TaxID=2976241 RepID=A0ABY6BFF1_9GAMM|nr:biosynthetic arginine decarboxylase [Tahibacter amnicola]UXI68326.1 biosynthetic arginine decarboxylase [Tahibacter amnicola]